MAAPPKIRIYRSKDYKKWHKSLSDKDKRIVDSRIDVFKKDGILKLIKPLDLKLSLYEFKWVNGIRVYFSLLQDKDGNFMLLLQGGNKNSQDQDIMRAKNLIYKALMGILRKKRKT